MYLQNPHDEDCFHVHDHHVENHDQPSVVTDQEKRLRRMTCNRESARRSRMQGKMKMERLKTQVEQVMASNQFLSDKYVSLLELSHQILLENSQLKKALSSFQEYYTTLCYGKRDDDHMPANINDFDLNLQSLDQPY
ncbi:hypothetical protein CARUB_v10003688mg [Capsella rubella]|uniref:BZIP domain-containing protein n=1 Tax=Capsella rubella TaxID=81985 RepID=R0FLV4_9BRAS|nr:hypothetical protein CARUB_v10003688mg [Capsella rubella]